MHKITKILRKLKALKIKKKIMEESKKVFAEFEKSRKK